MEDQKVDSRYKLCSWGPFVCQETNLFIRVMKLIVLQVLNVLERKLLIFLLRKKKCYSLIAMVDEQIASVLSACFQSPLQFNCKLVCYCNIWSSRWTLSLCFPCCIPWCNRKFCGTLTDIGPWSLGRTSGTITVSVWTLLCSFWR